MLTKHHFGAFFSNKIFYAEKMVKVAKKFNENDYKYSKK